MKRSEIEQALKNVVDVVVDRINSAPLWSSAICLLLGIVMGLNLFAAVILICCCAIATGILCVTCERDDPNYDKSQHMFAGVETLTSHKAQKRTNGSGKNLGAAA